MTPKLNTLRKSVIEDADGSPFATHLEYLAQINSPADLGNFHDLGNGAMLALAVEAAQALGLDEQEVSRLEDKWQLRHITRKVNARKPTAIDIQPDGTAMRKALSAIMKTQMIIYHVTFKHVRTGATNVATIPGYSFLGIMTYADKCAGHSYVIEQVLKLPDQEE